MIKFPHRLTCAALALIGLGLPVTATAGAVEDAYFGDMEVTGLNEADLDDLRGGFMTPLGFEVGFGAVVTATVDGVEALKTEWTVSDLGGLTKNVFAGGQAVKSPALDTDAAELGGIKFENPQNLTGVVVPGNPDKGGGATAIFQGFDLSGLSTAIINTASYRNIKTDTQLTVEIPQLQLDAMSAQKSAAQVIDPLAQRLAFGGL